MLFSAEPEALGLSERWSFGPSRSWALAAALALSCPARGAGPTAPPVLPPSIGAQRLQSLLQDFVDKAYQKAFRHLGDERDFDHGHFLFASQAPEAPPVAILYHTQELAFYAAARSGYEWLDPDGRNWIQWLSDGRIENARGYLRPGPRRAASFDEQTLERHHTILAEMLEPKAFGASSALRSRQVVFTRSTCPAAEATPDILQIRLPASERVCLTLSAF